MGRGARLGFRRDASLSQQRRRVSLEECRELLGDSAPESDEEVAAIRDHVYRFARWTIGEYKRLKREGGSLPGGGRSRDEG